MTRRVRFTPLVRAGVFAVSLGAAALAQAREVPFAAPLPVYTVAGPVAHWAPADIDGDADLDLLVASPAEGRLLLLRNADGAGAVWSAVTVSTAASGARDTVAGDLDGDGDMDAASVSYPSGLLAWHENLDAAGTAWTTHTIGTDAGLALEVADIDRDGDLDLVALPRFNDAPLRWFRNGGGGASWTTHTIGTTTPAEPNIDVVDIDRDGDPDVLTTGGGDAAWFESSNGGTAWSPHTAGHDAGSGVAAGDLDGDGDPDVIGTAAWFENERAGSWTPHVFMQVGGFGASMPTTADVDDDGDVDIWAHEHAGSVVWYDNVSGDGLQLMRRAVATASDPSAAIPVDLDGDGDLDALSAFGSGPTVIFRQTNETLHRNACFAPPNVVATFGTIGFLTWSLVTADVDGDGDLDAVSNHAGFNATSLLWNENPGGPGPWPPHTLSTTATVRTSSLDAGDVDGDGDLDILVHIRGQAYADRGIFWLENQGAGASFAARPIHTLSYFYPYGGRLHLTDIDGDGDLDALFGADALFSLWYRNNGVSAPWGLTWMSDANQAEVGDIDRDGDPDLYARRGANPSLLQWLENREAEGGGWVYTTLGAVENPFIHRAGDVDGDGAVDLLTNSDKGADLLWYRNVGSGSQFVVQTVSGNFTDSVRAADLDGDGDNDLLTRTGTPAAWYENLLGDESSWLARTIAGPDGGYVAAVDIDRDGDLDVLGARETLRWNENRGGQYALDGVSQAPGTAQQGTLVPMLRVAATHLGRPGDGALELARLGLLLEEGAGDPLTTAEANALVESLRVYRDANANGLFDPADALATSIGTLALTGGVQLVPFADGDPTMTVAVGEPGSYFVVVELTEGAAVQNPNRLRVTLLQLGPSPSQAEHAAYDIALSPACPADASSGVTVAVVPVELMGFSIE